MHQISIYNLCYLGSICQTRNLIYLLVVFSRFYLIGLKPYLSTTCVIWVLSARLGTVYIYQLCFLGSILQARNLIYLLPVLSGFYLLDQEPYISSSCVFQVISYRLSTTCAIWVLSTRLGTLYIYQLCYLGSILQALSIYYLCYLGSIYQARNLIYLLVVLSRFYLIGLIYLLPVLSGFYLLGQEPYV